jgi:uncharacterized protein (TIGR02266 family)
MMRSSGDERRISPRIKTDARCWLEQESMTLLGTVTNISDGGLFLRTPVPVAEGSRVDLTLNLGEGVVEARGRVMWIAGEHQEARYSGLGIRFECIAAGGGVLYGFLQDSTADQN